jgi:hypothetical protein
MRRLPAALAAAAVAATAAAPVAQAASQQRSFVVYAKPVRAQFVSHAGDRERTSNLVNPFNPDFLPTPKNANNGKKGTRAGDRAIVSLTLYADRKLTRPVGTAIYSCRFNFGQEAVCEAQFELGKGTIIALGPMRLDGSPIVLPVTGGTDRYRGAHGQMTSTSAHNKKNTQIIHFELV